MGFTTCWLFVSLLCSIVKILHTDVSSQLALLNYVIDAYLFVAASALASITVLRSLAGAVFPVSLLFDSSS